MNAKGVSKGTFARSFLSKAASSFVGTTAQLGCIWSDTLELADR